jgi:hypothetical protein
MKIITNSYKMIAAGLLALMMGTAFAPQSQASVSPQASTIIERVAPGYGGGGKDGTETHGRSIAPVNAKDGCETHD